LVAGAVGEGFFVGIRLGMMIRIRGEGVED
jgi:hypothetical protein